MYYYFEIKLLRSGTKFFFKRTGKYEKEKIENWKKNIDLVIHSEKTELKLMEEEDFLRKLNFEFTGTIKTEKEKIKIYKNENLIFYKIWSTERTRTSFTEKEVLISKEFNIKGEYFKYIILKK